jgi:hypothetical protein
MDTEINTKSQAVSQADIKEASNTHENAAIHEDCSICLDTIPEVKGSIACVSWLPMHPMNNIINI